MSLSFFFMAGGRGRGLCVQNERGEEKVGHSGGDVGHLARALDLPPTKAPRFLTVQREYLEIVLATIENVLESH